MMETVAHAKPTPSWRAHRQALHVWLEATGGDPARGRERISRFTRSEGGCVMNRCSFLVLVAFLIVIPAWSALAIPENLVLYW